MLGLDPRPFTFGELAAMALARRKEDWQHTAAESWAALHSFRSPKETRLKPNDLDPFHAARHVGIELTPDALHAWGKQFQRKNGGKN